MVSRGELGFEASTLATLSANTEVLIVAHPKRLSLMAPTAKPRAAAALVT